MSANPSLGGPLQNQSAALEVYTTNLSLTADQKTIADFWADNAGATGRPPGHWIAIA